MVVQNAPCPLPRCNLRASHVSCAANVLPQSRAVDKQPIALFTVMMPRAARKMAGERLHVIEFVFAALAARVLGGVPAVLGQCALAGEVAVAGIAVVAHGVICELYVRTVVE